MNEINYSIFSEGWQAKNYQMKTALKQQNQYPKDSNDWKSWNKGFNDNEIHKIKKPIDINYVCESCGGVNCIC